MRNNTTQLFLTPLASPRCKTEDLYGNSGIHYRKLIGWLSPFRCLGVREIPGIYFSVFIQNGGASCPRRNAIQPAAPWCPTSPQRSGKDSHHQPLEVRGLSPSHIRILFCCKDEVARSAPYRPRASPLLATRRPFLEWDAPQHGTGGQTQALYAYLDVGTDGSTHQTFTDAACLLSQTNKMPRGPRGRTLLPRQQHLRGEGHKLHHVSPNSLLRIFTWARSNRARTAFGTGSHDRRVCRKVSPQLSLTFNLIQTCECPSHRLKVSLFKCT